MPTRIGRKTKLTPALTEAIARAVAVGVPLPQAALLAGVPPHTAKEWVARGAGTDERPATPLYATFATAITRAKAQDEARRLARLEQAGRGGAVVKRKTTTYPDGRVVTDEEVSPPDWRADAFYLERAYRDRWGRTEKVDLTLQIQQAAQEVADEIGIDVQLLLGEAQAYLREHDAARKGR